MHVSGADSNDTQSLTFLNEQNNYNCTIQIFKIKSAEKVNHMKPFERVNFMG